MSDSQWPKDGIRAVFFDAVGTLLHPQPAAVEVYATVGHRHKSRLDVATIAARFTKAFRHQEQADLLGGHRTDEERELRRWRMIVAEVLDDVTDPEGCFQELYHHFAQPSAWRCEPGTKEVLDTLAARGFFPGIASNFDHRLRRLVQEMPELHSVQHLVISSDVGWRKPAGTFFEAVAAAARLIPSQILFIGDNWENDYEGARAAGMRPVVLDRGAHAPGHGQRVGALTEVLTLLR